MFLYIDSIGDQYLTCEDNYGELHYVEKIKAPKNIKEGDVIVINKDQSIRIDIQETNKRKKEIREIEKRLFGNSKWIYRS